MNNSADCKYGECRCCSATGMHRDITVEYYFNGVREVYYDIFGECYNLYLSKNPLLTMLICDNCVSRLRDAYSFKMMVAGTERRLLTVTSGLPSMFVDVEIEPHSKTDVLIKCETIKAEIEEENCDNDFFVGDNTDQHPDSGGLVLGETELLARHHDVKPLPQRYHLHTICPKFVEQLEVLQNITVTSSTVKLLENQNERDFRKGYVSEKCAYIINATTLLRFSNITPFRSKNRAGFPCFFCKKNFEDFSKLREHNVEHKSIEIMKALKQFGPESLLVYVDVVDMKCTICGASLTSINELRTHLTKEHKKKLVPDVCDRVIPFKIVGTVYDCQLCAGKFETFGSLERHMNGHFRNYVCESCGSGFATKCRLKVHVKSMHTSGDFPCEICGKTFTTQQKYRNHVNSVHKMVKRFKCVKCSERFAEYFKRAKHMVEVHGLAPLKYKCNVCDRSFDRRYTLSRHLKRDHLEERDYECEICAYRCFTVSELRVHMVKHNGERIFECGVCKKAYARKKTLKEHMRIHNNDRRFVCPVCGQAFVQKCSLKGHLKTHHLEFSMQSS